MGVATINGAHMTAPAPSVLLIVSRHSSTLYAYACSEFQGLGSEIDVILDRRRGERRRARIVTGTDRRRGDRRARPVDQDLRGIGWAIIRRDVSPGARAWPGADARATG
jgi:hypothetical protein